VVADLVAVELTYPGPPPVTAVRGCNLSVRAGEFAAVIGASGSGKSSLLNVMGLLDEPTAGAYVLNGLDVAHLSDTERTAVRARSIGFVFQAFHLIDHRTATENVALGLLYSQVRRRERAARAREALDLVGLSHRADALPSTLSGGERQRVAIARALAGRPALLLCDEPTGNLDSGTTDTVLDLLSELHRDGVTIVVITHDMHVADRAERVLRMRDGVLTETTREQPAGTDDDRPWRWRVDEP
jgi:putative ABC transport system ATP-binding protein